MTFNLKENFIYRFALAFALNAMCVQGAHWSGFRAPPCAPAESVPGFLWLEAEAFADYGSWIIDTQFVGQMGSAVLLGAGVTGPCAAATTRVTIPRAGMWLAWVRTRDWLPAYHPGRFALEIGGRRSPDLGNDGRGNWGWQSAGVYQLAAGETDVRIIDLTGWFARCDAILLTTNAAYVPPDEAAATECARRRFSGRTLEHDGGAADVVVVGAGPAGTTAAIQAARAGARTLLVTDRPLLGGNASSEFRIAPRGAGTYRPSCQEGGIDAEMLAIVHATPGTDWSDAYRQLALAERLLTVVTNVRVVAASKTNGLLTAVQGVDTLTGARQRWQGRMFIDATGDGWLGYFAGAAYRLGSEARSEFGEPLASEWATAQIMSGSLYSGLGRTTGAIAAFHSERLPEDESPFLAPSWANLKLPSRYERMTCRRWDGLALEHAFDMNEVEDPEGARDELIRMVVTYWDWAKNRAVNRTEGQSRRLVCIPHTLARREGRRLMGDYVLTEVDQMAGRHFEDAIGYGGYPITTHNPAGTFGEKLGYPRPEPPLYDIPYRSLYSTNVPNLFVCGRCCSMTHRALGSMRVQSTCAVTGQAAGLAAARCVKTGLLPRSYGRLHIRDLQCALRSAGQRIRGAEEK